MRRPKPRERDRAHAVLAVDGGGSKGRAALEYRGRLLVRTAWRGLNPSDVGCREFDRRLAALLDPILASLPDRRTPMVACLALAGVGDAAIRRECRRLASRRLRRYGPCRRLSVLTDVGGVAEARLGDRDGIVLVAGTGSIAVAVAHTGGGRRAGSRAGAAWGRRIVRVGGRGGDSDRGSGYAIGAAASATPSPALPRSAVSSRAAAVLEASARGDPAALRIVRQAACDLAGLALEAGRKAGLRGAVDVYLAGGLFLNRRFANLVAARLARAMPNARVSTIREPLLDILGLARRQASAGPARSGDSLS